MPDCVVYARVSTKEQQDEGYSIPAQLKAIRAFSKAEGLAVAAEFIEAESAGSAGRTEFTRMLAFLKEHPDVRIVVAHKLDRLYRNFADQIQLEELIGARARYVLGDMPATPQGELLRDVQLSVAKYYLGNLREEVKKGMNEKAAQGGWPHKAPLGYLNDKNTRSIVLDAERAPLVRYAFERYATGLTSSTALVTELHEKGLVAKSGKKLHHNVLLKILKNPFYCGLVVYDGATYPGKHPALISQGLFEQVQERFQPNRRNCRQKHTFVLRDFMFCDECGAKITAEKQKGHTYYHCIGKRDVCSQRRQYWREEPLVQEVAALLRRIEIGPEVVAALVEDAKALDRELDSELEAERVRINSALAASRQKGSVLTDKLAQGLLDDDIYQEKMTEYQAERQRFERQLIGLDQRADSTYSLVKALGDAATSLTINFNAANDDGKREVLAIVISNLTIRDGHITSYQWKRPFDVFEKDSEGAFVFDWWSQGGSNP